MGSEELQAAVDMTVLVCTFNRCADLREMLESALAQKTEGKFTFEILVVDNNSIDDTRGVVEEFIACGHTNLRYLFEGQQGKSHALNTGLMAARGWIYTIADDDFILPEMWLKDIFEAFRAHPEASFVSGKVLPLWLGQAPAWLTPKHWSAIAMADYGDEEFYADETNQVCLLACSFRLADVKAVGGYHSELGVSKKTIGGTEDLDILQRLWKAGRKGIYLPHIAFHHKVAPDRLTKKYHHRWHTGHGYFYAVMHDQQVEQSSARLLDVPSHLYKQAAIDAVGWLKCKLQGRSDEAFRHETQICFFAGFFRKRREDFLVDKRPDIMREIISFVRSLISKRKRRGTAKEVR